MTYVGHQVSEGGISRNPDKVAAVAEWKVPYSYSVKELGLFLGFQGCYRRSVSRYAQI